MKRIKLLAAFFAVIMLSFSVAIYSADEPKKEGKEDLTVKDKEDERNYLKLFDAKANIERLVKSNLEEINTASVAIQNFGKDASFSNVEVPDKIDPNKKEKVDVQKEFEEVKKDYKNAMLMYYKRHYVRSNNDLLEVQKRIHKLYRGMFIGYLNKTNEILDKCANKLMEMDTDPKTHRNDKSKEKLQINQTRLRLAYNNLADAEAADYSDYYVGALFYLRVAKSYGIAILDDLDPEASKPKDPNGPYAVDREDNKGRVKQ